MSSAIATRVIRAVSRMFTKRAYICPIMPDTHGRVDQPCHMGSLAGFQSTVDSRVSRPMSFGSRVTCALSSVSSLSSCRALTKSVVSCNRLCRPFDLQLYVVCLSTSARASHMPPCGMLDEFLQMETTDANIKDFASRLHATTYQIWQAGRKYKTRRGSRGRRKSKFSESSNANAEPFTTVDVESTSKSTSASDASWLDCYHGLQHVLILFIGSFQNFLESFRPGASMNSARLESLKPAGMSRNHWEPVMSSGILKNQFSYIKKQQSFGVASRICLCFFVVAYLYG